ncbi:MAG: hypothetical protein ACI8PZ_001087, partial [Myxococcota bacterium]
MILLLTATMASAQAPDRLGWIEAAVTAHGLTEAQSTALTAIATASDRLGQGLPGPTTHPMTPEACAQHRTEAGTTGPSAAHQAVCGRPWMAPLYDPASQTPEQAAVCIDQYEFPGVPCAYPVVWVRASEAASLCEAVGKRLCDAHEWEGACAGALRPPDYRYDLAAGKSAASAQAAMRGAHNQAEDPTKAWSTGPERPAAGVCGQGSTKSAGCDGSDPKVCGSNTYPAGAFPHCSSPLDVYDLHGNAAEHMNLPLTPDQLANGGRPL